MYIVLPYIANGNIMLVCRLSLYLNHVTSRLFHIPKSQKWKYNNRKKKKCKYYITTIRCTRYVTRWSTPVGLPFVPLCWSLLNHLAVYTFYVLPKSHMNICSKTQSSASPTLTLSFTLSVNCVYKYIVSAHPWASSGMLSLSPPDSNTSWAFLSVNVSVRTTKRL